MFVLLNFVIRGRARERADFHSSLMYGIFDIILFPAALTPTPLPRTSEGANKQIGRGQKCEKVGKM